MRYQKDGRGQKEKGGEMVSLNEKKRKGKWR